MANAYSLSISQFKYAHLQKSSSSLSPQRSRLSFNSASSRRLSVAVKCIQAPREIVVPPGETVMVKITSPMVNLNVDQSSSAAAANTPPRTVIESIEDALGVGFVSTVLTDSVSNKINNINFGLLIETVANASTSDPGKLKVAYQCANAFDVIMKFWLLQVYNAYFKPSGQDNAEKEKAGAAEKKKVGAAGNKLAANGNKSDPGIVGGAEKGEGGDDDKNSAGKGKSSDAADDKNAAAGGGESDDDKNTAGKGKSSDAADDMNAAAGEGVDAADDVS